MAPWFLWLLVAVGLIAAGYFGYRVWRKSQEKTQKSQVVRKALEMHHETILLCIRCVEDDVAAVVRCLAQAFAMAKSPLRLRVAVVQENSVVDVYEALLKHLNKYAATQQNYADKIRTMNLIECEGFQQAFDCWRDLYDDEKYVLCLDPSIQLLSEWDTKVVDVADSVPDHVVCSAPGPSEFAAFVSAPPHQRNWPTVVGRKFVFDAESVVPAVAVHHSFALFHGSHFAKIPTCRDHVPLYIADVAWSDRMYNAGTRFATVPSKVFDTFDFDDEHLQDQRPTRWRRKLFLTAAYGRFAGIKITTSEDEDFADHEVSSPRAHKASYKDKYKDKYVQEFRLLPRSKVGVTALALSTDEGVVKYGTKREIQRQLTLAAREKR